MPAPAKEILKSFITRSLNISLATILAILILMQQAVNFLTR